MSKVGKFIKKVFKKVVRFVKKVIVPIVAVAAIVWTAGAALTAFAPAGGVLSSIGGALTGAVEGAASFVANGIAKAASGVKSLFTGAETAATTAGTSGVNLAAGEGIAAGTGLAEGAVAAELGSVAAPSAVSSGFGLTEGAAAEAIGSVAASGVQAGTAAAGGAATSTLGKVAEFWGGLDSTGKLIAAKTAADIGASLFAETPEQGQDRDFRGAFYGVDRGGASANLFAPGDATGTAVNPLPSPPLQTASQRRGVAPQRPGFTSNILPEGPSANLFQGAAYG